MEKQKIELFKTIVYANYLKISNEKQFKKKLNLIHRKEKGRVRTNVGGYQSNNLSINEPVFKPFLDALSLEVNEFAKDYNVLNELQISNFWLNINGYKDFNSTHTHPNSIFSGVYYIDTPKNSGKIEFQNIGKELMDWSCQHIDYSGYNVVNGTKYALDTGKDLLLIFPSYLSHSVKPNLNKKQKRISISFNFWFKNK